jgi:hypothetical protein
MKSVWVGLLVALGILGAVMLVRPKDDGLKKSPTTVNVPGRDGPRASSEMVLSIAPGTSRTSGAAAAPSPKPAFSPLMTEFSRRREYKPLYDDIRRSATPTPEQMYVLAEILDNCATVTDRNPPRRTGWKLGGANAKERLAASLGARDPNRDKRLAAFDQINVDPCAGFEKITTTQQEVRELLEKAARAGEPKAKASLLYRELVEPSRTELFISLSDAQLDTFKQVIASGDPRAILDGVQILSGNYDNFSVRVGPNEQPLEFLAMHYAATLAACDLGYPCGPDSRFMLQECALNGQCDSASYRDHLFFYLVPPSMAQTAAEYHVQLMRAIRENDWSYFTIHRGPAAYLAPFQRR